MKPVMLHVFSAPIFSLLLVLVVAAWTSPPAYAQQPVEEYASGEPSADQVQLNQSAVEAILAEDYDKATGLLEASLELGKLNVTYLNLGRAYQKLEECEKAKRAYLAVLTAPAVAEPPPKLINAKAEQYLEELEQECAARGDGGERVDAGDSAAGDSAAGDSMAGDSMAGDSMAGDSAAGIQEASKQGGDTKQADALGKTPVAPAESSNVLGWSATIGGGVLLATSAVFFGLGAAEHAEVERAHAGSNLAADGSVTQMTRREALDHQARGDLFNTIALSTAIAGTAAAGLGVYWLWSDDSEQGDTRVSLEAGAKGWTLGFSTQF